MNGLSTLKNYEKNMLGSWTLSINNGSSCWENPDNVQKINRLFLSLFEELSKKLPALIVLRAIVVTPDVIQEYDRLLEETERKARVDLPRAGLVIGKVLTWGSCENLENYFALIVINEGVCISSVFEDDSESKCMIAHELAHIAEGYVTRNVKGNEKEDIYQHEWEKIRFSKAANVYSEFFAQIIAYPYYTNKNILQKHINYAIALLDSATVFLNHEITKYRKSADMGRLWPISVSELSRVFDQIGRSIGLLVCIDYEENESSWNTFIEQVKEVNPSWVAVIEEFRSALLAIDKIEQDSFNPLCEAINHGFIAAGLAPEILEDGVLYIHVPE